MVSSKPIRGPVSKKKMAGFYRMTPEADLCPPYTHVHPHEHTHTEMQTKNTIFDS